MKFDGHSWKSRFWLFLRQFYTAPLTQQPEHQAKEVRGDRSVGVGPGEVEDEEELREQHHVHQVAAENAGKRKNNKKGIRNLNAFVSNNRL